LLMTESDVLPCPSCGSRRTLAKLRKKREEVAKRLKEQERRRYPPVQSKWSTQVTVLPGQLIDHGSISLAPTGTELVSGKNTLTIGAAGEHETATVVVNDALLDVCIDCGTFYAPNAKILGEQIEEETIKMDPLGALAEIADPE
jgi:DNA-directed RNA polymerase subunit RPC12/RpoP